MSAGNYPQQRQGGGYGGLVVIGLAVWLLFFGGLSTLQQLAPGILGTIQTGAGRVLPATARPPAVVSGPIVVRPPVVSAPPAAAPAADVPGYTRQADGSLVRTDAPAAANTAPEIPTAVVSLPTALPAADVPAAIAASVAAHPDAAAQAVIECGAACTLPPTAAPTAAPPPPPAPVAGTDFTAQVAPANTADGWQTTMRITLKDGATCQVVEPRKMSEQQMTEYAQFARSGVMACERQP